MAASSPSFSLQLARSSSPLAYTRPNATGIPPQLRSQLTDRSSETTAQARRCQSVAPSIVVTGW